MQIGEFFDPRCYEVMAKAQTDHGCVVIVHNHSSHILVGTIADEAMTDGETTGTARLEASHHYHVEYPTWRDCYLRALGDMTDLVARDSSEQDEEGWPPPPQPIPIAKPRVAHVWTIVGIAAALGAIYFAILRRVM